MMNAKFMFIFVIAFIIAYALYQIIKKWSGEDFFAAFFIVMSFFLLYRMLLYAIREDRSG